MIQTSVEGSMILLVGRILSTFISAAGSIMVARFLGSQKFGTMNIALIPITFALLFVNNGSRSAMVRHIAEYKHANEPKKIQEIIVNGFALNIIVGLIVSLIVFFCSGILANQIFNLPEIASVIRILSLSVIFQALVNISSGVLIGFEKMNQSVMLNILQSLARTVIGPTLIYLGLGITGAAYGYSIPFVISGIFGVIFVYMNQRELRLSLSLFKVETFRTIIVYISPLFLSNIVSGGYNRLLEFVLSLNTTTVLIGNYSAARSFGLLVSFFISPVSTATFPLLSKLNPKDQVFKKVYQNIIKYESLIVFPITFTLIAFSQHFVSILYGPTYTHTALYMQIYLLTFLFTGIGSSSNYVVLNSQKKTNIGFKATVIIASIGIPLGIFLIPEYGVIGRLIIYIVAPIFGHLYVLIWLKNNYNVNPEYNNIAKIFISALIGFVFCKSFLFYSNINPWVEIFIGGIIILVSYLVLILLTGAITKENLNEIQKIVISYEMLYPILNPLFNALKRVARE